MIIIGRKPKRVFTRAPPPQNMAPIRCLLRRACSSVISSSSVPPLHNSPRFLPFSTGCAMDHAGLVESTVEEVAPWPCVKDHPCLPVPRGFPFTIEDYPEGVIFVRQDKDERTEILFQLNGNKLTNGSPSFECVDINVRRGCWYSLLHTLVGSNMWRIWKVKMRGKPDGCFKCYEEIINSKGIDSRKIVNLFAKQMKDNGSTDA